MFLPIQANVTLESFPSKSSISKFGQWICAAQGGGLVVVCSTTTKGTKAGTVPNSNPVTEGVLLNAARDLYEKKYKTNKIKLVRHPSQC